MSTLPVHLAPAVTTRRTSTTRRHTAPTIAPFALPNGDQLMSTQPARPAWQMPPGLPQARDDSWAYILDDTEVVYGPGWWPFYADRRWPLAGGSTDRTLQPCGVRLAPDVAFYAWHTEYLSLYPTDEPGAVDGGCHVVPSGTPRHDAERVAFRLRMRDDGWAVEPIGSLQRGQDILAEKVRRAIDFLRAAIAERDGDATRPTTAADCYTAEQETATPTRTRPHPQPEPNQLDDNTRPRCTEPSGRPRQPRSHRTT